MQETGSSLPDVLKGTRSKDWKTRARAALALRNMGASATSTLIRMSLKDENGKVRELASTSLGRICPATGIMPLVEALADLDQMVKERAADALAKMLTDCSDMRLDGFERKLDESASLPGVRQNPYAKATISSLRRRIAERKTGAFMGGILLSRERIRPPAAREGGARRRALVR